MKISIYGHSGSYNHGNEAIVRGIANLFQEKPIRLYSFDPSIDNKFKLNEICEVKPFFDEIQKYSLLHIISILYVKLKKNPWMRYRFFLKSFFKEIDGIYLLEAGDQYCENNNLRRFYAYLNKKIRKHGGKTVMLGCTINGDILNDQKLIEDLKGYSLIIARESITYNELLKAGIIENVFLAPDPAFLMTSVECDLPAVFNKAVVGVNTGFLKQGNEKHYELMMKNCIELIRYILSETDFNVILIPHVNWNEINSDFVALNELYNIFQQDFQGRIEVASEKRADHQKYIMSKCKFVIALRTHVAVPSIAAQVPTLVTGYKVKSTGIVFDIFPLDFKVLAAVASLKSENDYIEHFLWMMANESIINTFMQKEVPNYVKKAYIIKDLILRLE